MSFSDLIKRQTKSSIPATVANDNIVQITRDM
jgi:hypothetical protein